MCRRLEGVNLNLKKISLIILIFLLAILPLKAETLKDWIAKGMALVNEMDFEGAIKCWDKAIEIDPNCIDAWHYKGLTLYHMKNYEEAIKCYDKVLEINPKYTYAWCDKGRALTVQGKYEEAIECFDMALKLDPEDIYSRKFREEALKALNEKK